MRALSQHAHNNKTDPGADAVGLLDVGLIRDQEGAMAGVFFIWKETLGLGTYHPKEQI
jgi:hypothetical protein